MHDGRGVPGIVFIALPPRRAGAQRAADAPIRVVGHGLLVLTRLGVVAATVLLLVLRLRQSLLQWRVCVRVCVASLSRAQ